MVFISGEGFGSFKLHPDEDDKGPITLLLGLYYIFPGEPSEFIVGLYI